MTLTSALKRLLFRISMGFMPRCACGGRTTRLRLVIAGGHIFGLLFSCGEHEVVVRRDKLYVVSSEDGDEEDEFEALGC